MDRLAIAHTCLVETGTSSCSGVVVDLHDGYVLTHSSLLLPHLSDRFNTFKRLTKDGHLKGDEFEGLDIHVTFEQRFRDQTKELESSQFGPKKYTRGFIVEPINLVASGSNPSLSASRFIKCQGQIKFVWRANRFAQTLRRLFPSSEWKFLEDSSEDEKNNAQKISKDQMYHMLPFFVLIKASVPKEWGVLTNHKFDWNFHRLTVGANVFVVGTPFGNLSPEVFLNSMSSGIVSNLAGDRQELILTDARCIPGSEGGAIYAGSPFSGHPVGMVVAPLCWKANEWVGLAIICNMAEIYASLKKHFKQHMETGTEVKYKGSLVLSSDNVLVKSTPLVLVSSGASWGSGVMICQHNRIILTCSHVVNGAKEVKVRVDEPNFTWHLADVVYATPEDQVYDIAVLKLRNFSQRVHWPQSVSVATEASEGTEVFVVGHAAFGEEHKLGPTVTRGIVSKVLYHQNQPVIIQASCSVNSGASGGALVDRSGQLLGIVVCNARDKDSGATYPHLNLSIPVATVWSTIRSYLELGNSSVLTELTLNDEGVKRLWSLQGRSLQGSESKAAKVLKSRL